MTSCRSLDGRPQSVASNSSVSGARLKLEGTALRSFARDRGGFACTRSLFAHGKNGFARGRVGFARLPTAHRTPSNGRFSRGISVEGRARSHRAACEPFRAAYEAFRPVCEVFGRAGKAVALAHEGQGHGDEVEGKIPHATFGVVETPKNE
jgi:hypothetical protein